MWFLAIPEIKFTLRSQKFNTNQEIIKAVEARFKELEASAPSVIFISKAPQIWIYMFFFLKKHANSKLRGYRFYGPSNLFSG